jgi:nucleoside 2-deoxyribosyltransferase
MKIYIAAPYAGDNKNTEIACDFADAISRIGHYPYVPHLTMNWHRLPRRPREYWLEVDRVWLRSCDAVFRVVGDSPGADAEVAYAQQLGIPVYYSIKAIEYADKLKEFRCWLDAFRNGISSRDDPEFIVLWDWLKDNFSADKIGLFLK